MVAALRALRTGLQIAGKIDKKYNINKIFIDKYVPPGYRKVAGFAYDAAGLAGIFIAAASYYYGNGIQKATVGPQTSEFSQERSRPTRRFGYRSRYRQQSCRRRRQSNTRRTRFMRYR